MTLCDAGPLIALLDSKQADANARCKSTLSILTGPLITTWPCFTEAMHFLGMRGGWSLQKLLWEFVKRGQVRFYALTEEDAERMCTLMETYSDTPMDLADASIVVAAEMLKLKRIFTLDSDFYVYRHNGNEPFDVVP